jgi:hypothetical protein
VTVDDFISLIEDYYGKYDNEKRREITREYLFDNFSGKDFAKLYKATLLEYSSKWGKVPDIAVFMEVVNNYNRANGEWYRYAGGTIEYLGDGIGVEKPGPEKISSPEVKQIGQKTGRNGT